MIEHIQEPENSDDALERHERLRFKERFKDDEMYQLAAKHLNRAEYRYKFAAMAMQGMLAFGKLERDELDVTGTIREIVAARAVSLADALLDRLESV